MADDESADQDEGDYDGDDAEYDEIDGIGIDVDGETSVQFECWWFQARRYGKCQITAALVHALQDVRV